MTNLAGLKVAKQLFASLSASFLLRSPLREDQPVLGLIGLEDLDLQSLTM